MDGYEMMKTLKENTSLQSVIVVNSNIEWSDVVEKVYSSGADYYLRKSDFTPSQIVYMIEKWLFDKKRNKTDPFPATHFVPSPGFFDSMKS
jgi:CheY-like chemotaxis protein